MARYIGSTPFRNPNEEAYNFRTRSFTRSTDLILDADGAVTFVRYGDRTLSNITYDSLFRISTFIETIGSSSYTVTITYDADGDIISITRA
jgi:hypothetical protein